MTTYVHKGVGAGIQCDKIIALDAGLDPRYNEHYRRYVPTTYTRTGVQYA